jgi:hypothetical protein
MSSNEHQQQTMKTKLKNLAVTVCVFAFTIGVNAQGYIVPNGVTYLGLSDLGAYETHVLQNPTNGGYTGFLLRPQSQTSFSFDVFVDEGVRVFQVSPNDPISLQPIQAGSYPELTAPNSYAFANGSTFYLGFYTGYNPWDSHGNYTGIYTDPVFGWAQYLNHNGVIEMRSSALEYGGCGIFAGTLNIIAVPEPSSLVLIGLGALCFGLRRWRLQS